MLFIPLLAAAVFVLLRGVEGTAARLARIALVPFVLFYTAWEVLIGVGLGLMVDEANRLPASEQPGAVTAIEEFADGGLIRTFEQIGTGFWIVALTLAGVALRRRAGAPLAVPVLLVLAALPIAWHVTPFGQAGLALFVVAVVLVVRGRPITGAVAAPTSRPAGAAPG